MNWTAACAWAETILDIEPRFLGVWRSNRGPGPYSVYLTHPDGMIECWWQDHKLWGKILVRQTYDTFDLSRTA